MWEITIIAGRLIGPIFYLVSADFNLQHLDWELQQQFADVFALALSSATQTLSSTSAPSQ